MKLFSLNHAKLVLTDSRHNWFHWFVVVMIRILCSLIAIPLTTYMAAIGFIIFSPQIQPYLSPVLVSKINFLSLQLPYFETVITFTVDQIGHRPQNGQPYISPSPWWSFVIGLPLILVGISWFLISFFNLYYSIFNSNYNRTHCPFCQEAFKIKR